MYQASLNGDKFANRQSAKIHVRSSKSFFRLSCGKKITSSYVQAAGDDSVWQEKLCKRCFKSFGLKNVNLASDSEQEENEDGAT